MASWNSRGLRGSMLEESLNMTNEKYRREKLALVQKIPTPITPMEFDKEHHHITLAYLSRKVPWIIWEMCRGFPSVLMPRSVPQTHFRCRISMSIRWNL